MSSTVPLTGNKENCLEIKKKHLDKIELPHINNVLVSTQEVTLT